MSKFKVGDEVVIRYSDREVGVGIVVYKKRKPYGLLCKISKGKYGWELHRSPHLGDESDFDTTKYNPNAKMWWADEAQLTLIDSRPQAVRAALRKDLLK